jgi:hypothetical protein
MTTNSIFPFLDEPKLNYETIKQLAKEHGLTIADLLALASKNDPFYVGRPSEAKAAQWFADIWQAFGYQSGVHLRRVHYQIVSQDPPVSRPDGSVYENTQKDWDYLNEASKWARYLNLVSPGAFVDRRNPEAIINATWYTPDDWLYEDPTPGYDVVGGWSDVSQDEIDPYVLPALPTLPSLPDDLPMLPRFKVRGYQGIQQSHHIEVWCEKTTMNDVLLPLCERYNVNLITGAGEMSITSVVEFLQRVRQAERPARIIYISDFDPAGLGMPISVARKVEYFQRNEGYDDLDLMLHPIALTAEQVATYQLPRVPVKATDLRKASWEAAYGKGQVELDALEALHPGELAEIVQEAILQWYDPTLSNRAWEQRYALDEALRDRRSTILAGYRDELDVLTQEYSLLVSDFAQTQALFTELVQDFQPQIDAYGERLDAIRQEARGLYARIVRALGQVAIDLDDYALPEPDLPPEDDRVLYRSERDYFEQLGRYKALRLGMS